MIRYSLCCDEGHRFDSWFYDSSAFDEQAGRGLVTCPTCNSHHIVKAIMAPAVAVSRRAPREMASASPDAAAPLARAPTETTLVDGARRDMIRAVREKILAETKDVGRAFAAEARRIHDAEMSHERIRGQATLAEARDLLEDGIMVLPLPVTPDDLN